MEIFDVDRKQILAVDGKQEIYLEWPWRIDFRACIAIRIIYTPDLISICLRSPKVPEPS